MAKKLLQSSHGRIPERIQVDFWNETLRRTTNLFISKCCFLHLPTYLHTYLPTYTRTYLPTYLPTYTRTYLPTYTRTYVPTHLPTYLVKIWYQSQYFLVFFFTNFQLLLRLIPLMFWPKNCFCLFNLNLGWLWSQSSQKWHTKAHSH